MLLDVDAHFSATFDGSIFAWMSLIFVSNTSRIAGVKRELSEHMRHYREDGMEHMVYGELHPEYPGPTCSGLTCNMKEENVS